jgi:hypothetical protein
MMPTESDRNFFTRDIRVLRSSIAGSFSLAGEGHRKRGRFPVELPYFEEPVTSNFSDTVTHKSAANCCIASIVHKDMVYIARFKIKSKVFSSWINS